jgi:serine/threonine protein kinase
LEHPGIVKIYKFFMVKKNLQAYFIMEYLEGGELLEYVAQKGNLCEEEARDYFSQIILAMAYCHSQKIIHRDLKLENILKVSNNCTKIKIVDFGIAGLCAGRKSEITKAGSLNYMAPEVFKRREVGASPQLDVWAIGCILYAMVIGNLPFVGKNDAELKKKICDEPVTWPADCTVSAGLKDLVIRILVKNPEKRYSMYDIKDHKWVTGESVSSGLAKDFEQRNKMEFGNDGLHGVIEEEEEENIGEPEEKPQSVKPKAKVGFGEGSTAGDKPRYSMNGRSKPSPPIGTKAKAGTRAGVSNPGPANSKRK